MARERILIAVKTYPTLSSTYAELVCTAGFREQGGWVRIYPSPFRFLEKDQQYGKYHWIELELEKNPQDPRPESFRPRDIDAITVHEKIGTERAWDERRKLILDKNPIHTNLEAIIQASRNNEYSLAIFKPTEILDVVVKPVAREWELPRKAAAEASLKQGSLFDDTDRSDFKLVRKIPYKFSYRFTDDAGKESTLMIEDWEIGALYWRYADSHGEEVAVAKVRQKYLDDFARTKDLYLFLGTVYTSHVRKLSNPYVVIGTFHPPKVTQPGLF
ncbi:MAG: hypothetical protein M0Q95_10120 [Porticoccaceae bacterium]|jgi:hypothetical protein|nr:hypothetical protein [Porticoccaceae bacterium]